MRRTIRTIRRTVPRPIYIADLLSDSLVVSASAVAKPPQTRRTREGDTCAGRLVSMTKRLLLALAAFAIVLVALTGAAADLAAGRRPVLLGGRAG
jgi:hypothetical protein